MANRAAGNKNNEQDESFGHELPSHKLEVNEHGKHIFLMFKHHIYIKHNCDHPQQRWGFPECFQVCFFVKMNHMKETFLPKKITCSFYKYLLSVY